MIAYAKILNITAACVSIVLTACTLLSCDFSPTDPKDGNGIDGSGKPGELVIKVASAGSRTVVPDVVALAQSYSVAYTNTTSPEHSGSASMLTGSVLTIPDVYPGVLSLTVTAYSSATVQNASTRIAGGNASVTLPEGGAAGVSVRLNPAQTPSVTSGSFSLAMTWPLTTGAAYVEAGLYNGDNTLIDTIIPTVATGSSYSATVVPDPVIPLASGPYRLVLSFYDSIAGAIKKGVFIETVNIYDGLTSSSWISADGTLLSSRDFGEEVFSSGATGVTVTTMLGSTQSTAELTSTVHRNVLLSLTNETSLRIMLEPSVGGQTFTIRRNSDPPSTVPTGAFQSYALDDGINTLDIIVTAPDGHSTGNYQISATRVTGPIFAVADEAGLMAIADEPGANYVLTDDIILNDPWDPITTFTGALDGNGYSITGLEIDTTITQTGLVGANEGIITNLIISDAELNNQYTPDVGDDGARAGILVGFNSGTLFHCSVSGTIHNDTTVNAARFAGLVGINAEGGTIRECYSVADVVCNNAFYIASLVGTNQATIVDCYARGDVTGYHNVGGLVGNHENNPPSMGNVTNCYSTGTIVITGSGTNGGGCIGGSVSGVTTVSSYYDSETSGATPTASGSPHGTPLTTANMKLADNFIGWNFDSVWGIDPAINDGYPYLRYFGEATMIPAP